jgi:hypothetical protein
MDNSEPLHGPEDGGIGQRSVADSAPLFRTSKAKTHFNILLHRKYNTLYRRLSQLLIGTGLNDNMRRSRWKTCQETQRQKDVRICLKVNSNQIATTQPQ